MSRRAERGSITPLVIGFAIVLVMLVGVVVDASAAFLKRQQLHSLADAAALAATEGIQGEQVYMHGLGEQAMIDPGVARARAAERLHAARVTGLRFRIVTRDDSVSVHVRAPLDLPFRIGGIGGAVMISGSATAVVTVSE